jgi:hypothetical protein
MLPVHDNTMPTVLETTSNGLLLSSALRLLLTALSKIGTEPMFMLAARLTPILLPAQTTGALEPISTCAALLSTGRLPETVVQVFDLRSSGCRILPASARRARLEARTTSMRSIHHPRSAFGQHRQVALIVRSEFVGKDQDQVRS